jgi:hypothetical protein
MTQEALKLALDALEGVLDDAPKVLNASISGGLYEVVQCREAIIAIKEALAQTQEPVAVVDVHEFYDNCANFSLLQKLPKGKHTLYTTPPQRTWVGLTDEEAKKIETIMIYGNWSFLKIIKAIEAKLKEKNT